MIPPKDHDNFLVTDRPPSNMEIYKLPDKEVKIIVLRKLSELQRTQIDTSMKLGE